MRSPLPSKSRFFQYQAYGLSLRSCIRCPELTATNQEPDVRIAYRRLPKRLRQASAAGVCYQAARGRLLLSISHVARYLVSKGNQILIDRQAEAEDEDVRLFLITAALGALMHLRGLLPLRASAVEVGERAVLFLGPSAAGKSTLAGAFHQLGYRVLADHITVVSIAEDGMPWATPGYPRLRLWADVLKVLGIDTKSLPRVRANLEKYNLPLGRAFQPSPLPIRAIYLLSVSDIDHPRVSPLFGNEKLSSLLQCTYGLQFVAGLGVLRSHFIQCANLASRVKARRLLRPPKLSALDEVVKLVKEDCMA